MHFKINNKVFAEGIGKLDKVVKAKHANPILQGIYMEVTYEEVILIGSDNNESIKYHIPVDGESAEVFSPGSIVLPKQVTDTAKKFKKDITMELDNLQLKLFSGRSKFDLITFDPEEYPKLPKFDIEKPTVELKASIFNDFIRKTTKAVSFQEIRPILTGVLLEISNNCMKMISTDSHRLAQIKMNTEFNKELRLVIPSSALLNMSNTFDLHNDIQLYCEQENQAVFKCGQMLYYCRLLEGTYPDTSRLIPLEFNSEVKIHRETLLGEIELMKNISKNKDSNKEGTIKLHVNGAATLSTFANETGQAESVVEYESLDGGDDFTLGFSVKFITDALKVLDSEYINFKFQGAMRPFILTPCESKFDELQLILPVRMN